MFKNVSIVKRLIFLVSAIAVLMLAATIYIIVDARDELDTVQADMQETLDGANILSRVLYLTQRNRVILMDAGIHPDPENLAKREAEYGKNLNEVAEALKDYSDLEIDDKQRELFTNFTKHRETYVKEGLAPMLAALKAGNPAEALRIEHDKVSPLNEPIKVDIDAMNSYGQKLEEQQVAQLEAAAARKQYLTIAGVAAVLALSGLLAWTIIRAISGSLDKLQGTIARIAAGDAKVRVNLKTRDELGLLANQFDKMMDEREAVQAAIKKENDQLNESVLALLQAVAQLSRRDLTVKVPVSEDVTGAVADALNLLTSETAKVMVDVTNISADVTKASMTVQAKADTMLAAAEQEREEVDRTALSLATAAQSMRNIADLAQACNAVADNAIKATQQALNTVNSTVSGINSTRDVIRETEKRIKRLGERSQEISGVVNLINVIAERTHILALNASMHAASAGEAGRGFAVVADEVQRLAENARQATQQISALVSNIQVETADTVSAMNNAITQIVEGSRLAEQAGHQMQLTQQNTAELVDSVKQIASTSESQAKAGQALLDSAVQIKRSSEVASQQLHEQAAQTSNLLDYAKQLLGAVRVFKLPA